VRAAEVVKARGYSGPIFNDFTWGGYLGWALDAPVWIDGRGGLHGDAAIDRSAKTWAGEDGWSSDAALAQAGVVIAPRGTALSRLLRTDPQFRLLYEDGVAAVFLRR
jgi:hypothetical protein